MRQLLLPALFALAAGAAAQEWPSFRGPSASGVADGSPLPVTWTAADVRWAREIPGDGHSSPIVAGERVFLVTAIDRETEAGLRRAWQLLSFDRATGNVVWQRTAAELTPALHRHEKGSHANATPATDGQRVVAIVGEGLLVAYDFNGRRLWQADLGPLHLGLAGDRSSHWGYASSPVVGDGRAYVQVDRHAGSYVAAFDAATGARVWTAERDERPSWATPALVRGPERAELVVSSPNWVRGYDAATGEELWKLSSDVPVKVPSPVAADGLVYVTGGYPSGQPLYAVRVGARGDVSLKGDQMANKHVAFRLPTAGPYVPTPIVYRGRLYVVDDGGRVSAHDPATGKRLGRRDLPGNFSASPVAGDGKLYLASEEGTIHVLEAGDELKILGSNDLGSPLMATPAIAGGTLFVRTRARLYAIGGAPTAPAAR